MPLDFFRSGKLSVNVRLRAWTARMQYAALTNINSTGGTGDRGNLPRRQFSFLHCDSVRRRYPFGCSILNNCGPGSYFLELPWIPQQREVLPSRAGQH